jgi:hypothetical protein
MLSRQVILVHIPNFRDEKLNCLVADKTLGKKKKLKF